MDVTGHISKRLDDWLASTNPRLRAELHKVILNMPTEVGIPFQHWWDLYGKKISRPKCERAWKKLTPTEQATAMKHTEAYIEVTKGAKYEYRRHPYTYLNNHNFNDDDLITEKNATGAELERQNQLWDSIFTSGDERR